MITLGVLGGSKGCFFEMEIVRCLGWCGQENYRGVVPD